MLLSGKEPANNLLKSQIHRVNYLKEQGLLVRIDVILIAPSLEFSPYVLAKKKACEQIGILCQIHLLPTTLSEKSLLSFINGLNTDPQIAAILCQLPLPSHINPENIVKNIDKNKDIDGFHPENLGYLALGHEDGFIPCTPLAIVHLCNFYNITFSGKHVVILGRSRIVGLPLSLLLSQKKYGSTVTLCHSQTPNIEKYCQTADILIVAIGKPEFVKISWISQNCTVIDVGISRIESSDSPHGYIIKGDVESSISNINTNENTQHITPVPGGIGPLTVSMVIENCLKAWEKRIK